MARDAGLTPMSSVLFLFPSLGIFKDFRGNAIQAHTRCQSVESEKSLWLQAPQLVLTPRQGAGPRNQGRCLVVAETSLGYDKHF